MARTKTTRSHCPIAFGLDLFGDRWTLLILRDILFRQKSRYQDFLSSGEGISTNILAERLARLRKSGFLTCKGDLTDKRKHSYQPTDKTLDLLPMLFELILWSAKHDPNTDAPKRFIARASKDRDSLIAEIRRRFSTDHLRSQ